MTLSTAYETAIEVHNAALGVFSGEISAFRAGGCFDVFGAAQMVKKAADDAFDIAFNIESEREDVAECDAEIETQMALI